MKVKDLTEKQREEFVEIFYGEFWPADDNDLEDGIAAPWGCPWYWKEDFELGEGTVHDMVERFFEHYEDEIAEVVEW